VGLFDDTRRVAQLCVAVPAVIPDVIQGRVANDPVEPGTELVRLVAGQGTVGLDE